MKDPMEVSVIVVNYNTKEVTKDCIDSIFSHTSDVSFEVILVDNSSTDGSIELFEHDKRIFFIKNDMNVGFGNANNVGIAKATGKYLFFLNSDTYFLNNAIKVFYDFAETHQEEQIGAIGCLLRKRDGSYCHSYAPFPSINVEILKPILLPISRMIGKPWCYLDKPSFKAPYMPVDYVTGADLFVKKELVDQYGAFDPDFFMYYEESEMQYRWTKAGFVNYIISMPQIVHLEGCSNFQAKSMGRNTNKELIVFKSMFLYMKKTSSPIKYLFFRLCFAMVKLPFLFFSSLSWRARMSYVRLFFNLERI